jgi:subtilisin-like proprotein convertase family protein
LHKTLAVLALISLMAGNLMVTGAANVARNALSAPQTLTRSLNAPNVAQNILGPEAPKTPTKPYGVEVVSAEAFGKIESLAAINRNVPSTGRPEENEAPVLPKAFVGPQAFEPDAVLQTTTGPQAMPTPIANFDGLGSPEAGPYLPPDTNGDIGYDSTSGRRYYFSWVNVSYKAWDVTNPAAPTVVVSTTLGNALWAAALPGSRCALDNAGDPIVLFDEQAGRWFISQFALGSSFSGPFHQCIAVSQTANPAGGWYVYDFPYRDATTWLNDYPHFGVWPDPTYNAYYMTVNQFNASGTAWLGGGVAAYERALMLTGNPAAQAIYFDLFPVDPNFGGMLPADLDGLPAANGTPGFFFEVDDATWIPPNDAMRIWEFRPNWVTPASSTFGISGQPNYTITVPAFNLAPCVTSGSRACVPQQGTTTRLDSLGDRLMHRAAFRNFGAHQSVVLNHTVWADSTDRLGIRWYEMRRNPGTGAWSIFQSGTYAPADGNYRWMGSVAMDVQGNMAAGYSVSSGSMFPSAAYAGRLISDPTGTLSQTEVIAAAGLGAQTSASNRWGDYSMIGTDPQDQCTFWSIQEYHGATANTSWRTRVTSFKFPGCSVASGFTIIPTPPSQTICQSTNANYTVGVFSSGGFNSAVTMNAVGNPGTATFVPNPVTPPADGMTNTVLTISGATAGNYTFNITGTSGVSSSTAALGLNVVGSIASVPTLSSPADGATGVSVLAPLSWSASAGADTYYLEVATDAGFSTVVYSATVAGTSHTTAPLAPNTQFFWRVRAANVCGNSAFSTPFNFTTVNLAYATYCATPNQTIADNTTATTTLNIPSGGALVDVDVFITATHTWVGDLQFTLGNGTNSSMVVDRPGYTGSGFGCSGDNVGARLDDEGASGPVESQCSTTPPALFGNPTPNNPLSVFDGQTLAGTWSLAVRDNAGGDTGVLQSWCVVATIAGTSGANAAITLDKTVGTDHTVCASTDSISVPYGSNVTYCYKVTNTGNISLTTHDLWDNQLGAILSGFSLTLPPLGSVFVTETTMLTATTVNSATWTATAMTYTASASDMATVTVLVTPTISVLPGAFNVTQLANTTNNYPLTITNGGMGSTLNWAITETPGLPLTWLSTLAAPGSTATDRANASGTTSATPLTVRHAGAPALLPPVPTLNEGFDNIGTLSVSGWYTQNNSNPLGGTSWFQGNSTVFPAQGGAATAYIGANFNNTTGAGTISNWLLTPELNLANGATFTFYTRKTTTDTFPDRLQVRMSANGASTDVGASDSSVGDFTTLLLDINPTLVTGVYPTTWTQFSITISGLGAPTTGRLAFRYYVTNGGPSGANSDYIGIDTVTYSAPLTGCAAPANVPWLSVSQPSGSTAYGTPSSLNVGLNATGLSAGTYTATLCITSNAPATPLVQVPVTLTVQTGYWVYGPFIWKQP